MTLVALVAAVKRLGLVAFSKWQAADPARRSSRWIMPDGFVQSRR